MSVNKARNGTLGEWADFEAASYGDHSSDGKTASHHHITLSG